MTILWDQSKIHERSGVVKAYLAEAPGDRHRGLPRLRPGCQPGRGGVGLDEVPPAAELRPRGYAASFGPGCGRAVVAAEAARTCWPCMFGDMPREAAIAWGWGRQADRFGPPRGRKRARAAAPPSSRPDPEQSPGPQAASQGRDTPGHPMDTMTPPDLRRHRRLQGPPRRRHPARRGRLPRRQRPGRHRRPGRPARARWPRPWSSSRPPAGSSCRPSPPCRPPASRSPRSTPARPATSPRRPAGWPRPTGSTPAVLAHFAEAVRPEARPAAPAERRALDALLSRRRQLLEMRVMESNRLGACADPAVRAGLERHLAWLEAEAGRRRPAAGRGGRGQPGLAGAGRAAAEHPRDRAGGQPDAAGGPAGAGRRSTAGRLAALAGLAPFADDSGTRRGAAARSAAAGRRCAGCCTWRRCRRRGTTRPLKAFADRLRAARQEGRRWS